MSFFRDDFRPIHNGRGVTHTNFPKVIYGELVKRFIPKEHDHIEVIQMDSGVVYYRHLTFDPNSPYGWNYFHHYFRFNLLLKTALSDKENENLSYSISKHLLQIKILKSKNMFKDLSIEIEDFKGMYLALLKESGVDISTFEEELL